MLDARPDEFDHRNLFLHALMGVVSACRRLDAAVATQAVTTGEPPTSPDGDPAPADDPWLLCVLGMMSFRHRLMDHLASAPPVAPSREPEVSLTATLDIRRMLR